MSQSQNAIYYTTAQVTDMVELSDQNVRKYVRLLEDRNYEVAKDEHNRRLFSKKDVSVLQEMIKIAKSPGNTLDSAADEIIENMDDFEETKSENQVSKMSDNDVSRLLALVLEKLDEIQNENKELKSNISTLVHRLEEYDRNALEYNPVEKVETFLAEEAYESEKSPQTEEDTDETVQAEETKADETSDEAVMEETVTPETTEEEIVAEAPAEEESRNAGEENIEEESAEAETEELDTEETETAETPAEQNTGTIDLSAEEEKAEENVSSASEELDNSSETAKQQIEEPKKGFFGKLASMFKG
ncbi:hypothetical protein [Jeotgalicoccus halotolerans]|uniref:DNA-binding transcriptional MerR regulator n=1 Tax=Jeotgalicoccus halotolerans TaxID=157227 RepID=A0A3E0AYC7_9STAP|nr:hypothetical protein [Jeotgalicoccus halotolerans]REG24739.1 hypothetical protein DFR63_1046 [Jeotgalicoccus halotolerans]